MIDYALVVASGSTITLEDLPYRRLKPVNEKPATLPVSSIDAKDHYVILQIMKDRNDEGKTASRDLLSKESATLSHALSPQQIRLRLNDLENKGYIIKGRGRSGTQITLEGEQYLAQLKSYQKSR